MFGIGGTELLVLAAVALVVVGPKRLPEIMRLFGKGLGEFRRMANDVRTTVTAEMDRIDLEEKTKKAHEELFGDKKPEQPVAAAQAPEAQPSEAKAGTDAQAAGTEAKATETEAKAAETEAKAAGAEAKADASAKAPEPEHAAVDEWTMEQAEKKASTAATEGHELASVQTVDSVKAELDATREACRKAEAEGAAEKAGTSDAAVKTAETSADKAASKGEPGKPA